LSDSETRGGFAVLVGAFPDFAALNPGYTHYALSAVAFEVSAFEVVIRLKSYDNYLPAWHHQPEPEEAGETP